jgi:hypothetical protein
MNGDRFGIAAPASWIVGTDPGDPFDELQQERWGEPRVATSGDGSQAVLVAPLRSVAHDPLADPKLFWSDQVVGEGAGRTVSDSESIGVHGLKANRVMVNDRSGSLLAVAVETGHGTYLVAFRGPSDEAATNLSNRLIQTFDVR